jgi:hypothetical protein
VCVFVINLVKAIERVKDKDECRMGKKHCSSKKNQENIRSLVPAEVLEVELYILKFVYVTLPNPLPFLN